jgi:folate-binding protein YgfZ
VPQQGRRAPGHHPDGAADDGEAAGVTATGAGPSPAVGACRLARDVVRVGGPDAVDYLQGQLSQDVAGLVVGEASFSFLLQPQGKVDAFLRVTRVDDEELVLDLDAGWGDAVVARLRRFLLRTKAEIEPVDWSVVAVRGVVPEPPPGAWALPPETPGVPGADLLGESVAPPAGLPELDPVAYEVLRIRAGVPRMGAELDESTIPAATGAVERAVSFTKGCYTGQELVARIDARGDRVPTRLRGLVAAGPLEVGAAVTRDGRDVGRVTSAAGGVALAYVRREVEPPADVEVGGRPARVEVLPLRGD